VPLAIRNIIFSEFVALILKKSQHQFAYLQIKNTPVCKGVMFHQVKILNV
jgi:hypothetical protein